MIPHDSADGPGGLSDLSTEDEMLLAGAARAMRDHDDPRWVEVSSRILTTALRATRRSRPVRAQAPGGPVHISEHVIVAYLREALDGRVPGTAVAGIRLDISDEEVFTGVLIELIVQYGTAILPAADRIRADAATVLEGLLGSAAVGIQVRAGHVHVSDVTPHDPQTTDPLPRNPPR